MKIVHADTDDLDNPLRGGQPVRTFEINSRISNHHDVKVLTAVFPGAVRRKFHNGISYERLGLHIKPLGLSSHLSYLFCLGPRIMSLPHDIVVEEFMPPFGFCFLPWWTKKPVVTIVQWFFFDYWENRYHLPFKKGMKAISGFKKYKYFIVQTDTMGTRIRNLIPDAVIRKIPCGINTEAFIDPVSYDDFVLFLGRLDIWHKGLDILLDAWQKICAKIHIPLIIAGDGPARGVLQHRVRTLGLESLVTFSGIVGGEKKKELLKSCRMMVMPSREETFGISALEAMAAQKPVVAFDIENLNELVKPDWGKLVEPMNAELFGQTVSELWKDPGLCRDMGQRAYLSAQEYLWDNHAQAQIDFYHDVLEKSGT